MPNTVKIKNLIFDWSGTLYDDFDASYISTLSTLKHFGGPSITKEAYRHEFNLPAWKFYRRYLKGIPIRDLETFYFDHFTPVSFAKGSLYPQVKSILKKAKAMGFRLYICSSVRDSLLKDKCKKMGVASYFQHIYGSVRDKERQLPSICRRHHLRKHETIFIGDMEHDIDAAKKAGVLSGVFLSGYHSSDRLLNKAPDFVWNDQEGLLRFLGVCRGEPMCSPSIFGQTHGSAPTCHKSNPRYHRPIPTVGALIFNQGQIFLVQTHKWRHTFGIPGGKIEGGEKSEVALKREIWEETGLKIRNIRWAMVHDCIDSKEFYKPRQHFLLMNYYAESLSRKFKLNEESESGFWIDPKMALKLNLNQPTRVLIETFIKKNKFYGSTSSP